MKTKIKLNNKAKMPVLGLGTWKLNGNTAREIVSQALKLGYRHIDTAEAYGNQKAIGKAIKTSKEPREKVFITSKVWRTNLRPDDLKKALEHTLKDLQTDYLDLYLIHWPNSNIPLDKTLKTMRKLKKQGKIKAIGVSNFTIKHLKKALKTGVKIVTNQVEVHVSFQQPKLRKFCQENDIVVTAYSPLGQGGDLKLSLIEKLAWKYKHSEAQVILNWLLQKGMVVIPRTSDFEHLKDNLESLEWKLDKKDIKKIDKLNKKNRILNPTWAEF